MLKDYITEKNGMFVLEAESMEMYIPATYFERNLATQSGPDIRVFGLFTLRYFLGGKPQKLETFNVPTYVFLYPAEIEERTISLVDSVEPKRYVVAKFYKNGVIMPTEVSQDSLNVERFVMIVRDGNIDNAIPYSILSDLWISNLEVNGTSLGVQASIMELILSRSCRSMDGEVEYAKLVGKNPTKYGDHGYRAVNMREIASRSSVFSALTSEDMGVMITTSLNMGNYGKEQTESPIEKIIKM